MKKIFIASTLSLSVMVTSAIPSLANDFSSERSNALSAQRNEAPLIEEINGEFETELMNASELDKRFEKNQELHDRINSTEFSTLSPLEKTTLLNSSFNQQIRIYKELNNEKWVKLSSSEWKARQQFLDSQNEQVEKKIQRMNALLVEATVKDKKLLSKLEVLHQTIRAYEKESVLLESQFIKKVNELNKLEIDILTDVATLAIKEGRTVDAIEAWLNMHDYMKSDPEYLEILDALGAGKSPLLFMEGEQIKISGEKWEKDGTLWITAEQAGKILGRDVERTGETWTFRHLDSKVEWSKARTLIDEQPIGTPHLVSEEGMVRIDLLLTFMGYEVKVHDQRFVIEVTKPKLLHQATMWTFDDIRKMMIIK